MIVKNYKNLIDEEYKNISNFLKNGNLIIYPTETIYGIGCNALNKKAGDEIFKIKKRSKEKNFIWLLKNKEMIYSLFYVNEFEKKIIDKYLPGPISIILKYRHAPIEIACRISPHPFLKKLFNFINFPIISTSANISNKKYEHNLDYIIDTFKSKINMLIVDHESFRESPLPSTIVKVERGELKIIRQGRIFITF